MSDCHVLGINVSHDVSAALVKNGNLVCGIAEERLNRIKRFTGGIDVNGMTNKHLPQKAIRYCLDVAGIDYVDVDLFVVSTCVVVNYNSFETRSLTLEEILQQFPTPVDSKKVKIVGHHLGHAASAFYPSDFSEATIIISDGGGNLFPIKNGKTNEIEYFEERVGIYHGKVDEIKLVKQYTDGAPSEGILSNKKHCSLGDFYQSATLFAGFDGGDEGKTMGLAPFGTDKYFKEFSSAIQFNGESWSIDPEFQFNKWKIKNEKIYGGRFGKISELGKLSNVKKDIAAAAQHALEETLIRIAQYAYDLTKSTNLCLAGGVALNSVANKKILDNTPFEKIFVQPASGDDGCALGNCLLGWTSLLENSRIWRMKNAYTGRTYSKEEIDKAIEKYKFWCMPIKTDNVIKKTAELLSQKRILGWFQGGSEYGPRALGNRSILTDTRSPEMKDILNAKVKHREGFRPFAPSILNEYRSEYFELDVPSPFMLLVANVKKPNIIPSVTHVDGTARVQTVTKEDNGIYYDLISEFHNLTGVPVLLNTSFNVNGEPIVETPEDAIRCFVSTKIDYLVLGEIILSKHHARCLTFKTWPQDLKRIAYKKLKKLGRSYPFLRKIKRKIYLKRLTQKNIKVPG